MNLSLKNEIRRCRPLLGTFVEISVKHDDVSHARKAIDAAFAAIERVHKLMSFHDPKSEVSQLNRLAMKQPVSVSFATYQVLKCARELFEFSDGAFDVTVASELVDWKLLPRHEFFGRQKNYCGRTSDIALLPDGMVRFLRKLCIDLGGIAKGFAVDKAIEALQQNGIEDGLVNAGGDLRCFGDQEFPVLVRHPKIPGRLLPLPSLKNSALATSANSWDGENLDEQICVHVHGGTRNPLRRLFSVSVNADSCMMADALTKVVLALEQKSATILAKFNATAFIVYPDNRMLCFEGKKT